MRNTTTRKFLQTFNEPAPVQQPGPPPAPPPQQPYSAPVLHLPRPAPDAPMIPASALPSILSAADEYRHAQQVRQQFIAPQVQAPAPQAAEKPAKPEKDPVAEQLNQLQKTLLEERKARQEAELNAVYQQIMGQATSAGLDPAFAGYICGKTHAELVSSANQAFALQNEFMQRQAALMQQGPQGQQGGQRVPQQPAPVRGLPQQGQPLQQGFAYQQPQQANPFEAIGQFTNSRSVHNGNYAQNREQIFAMMQAQMPNNQSAGPQNIAAMQGGQSAYNPMVSPGFSFAGQFNQGQRVPGQSQQQYVGYAPSSMAAPPTSYGAPRFVPAPQNGVQNQFMQGGPPQFAPQAHPSMMGQFDPHMLEPEVVAANGGYFDPNAVVAMAQQSLGQNPRPRQPGQFG